jgi:hypothetical protein
MLADVPAVARTDKSPKISTRSYFVVMIAESGQNAYARMIECGMNRGNGKMNMGESGNPPLYGNGD